MKERHKYDASNFEYLDEVAQSFYAENEAQSFSGELDCCADGLHLPNNMLLF